MLISRKYCRFNGKLRLCFLQPQALINCQAFACSHCSNDLRIKTHYTNKRFIVKGISLIQFNITDISHAMIRLQVFTFLMATEL